MQDRKLKQALDIYFGGEPDRETKEFQDVQKYLKKQKEEPVNNAFAQALAGIKLD